MPVTKTAKRALRGSQRKKKINTEILKKLEIALRVAKKGRKVESILEAISLADRAAKKRAIHKNKAARIKSTLSKLSPTKPQKTKRKINKRASRGKIP